MRNKMDQEIIVEVINKWKFPRGGSLTERINKMIHLDLMKGYFGLNPTMIVGGVQYHLGGVRDTEELAYLASITSCDRVLDVACFLGGPALQLAESYRCRVIGIDKNGIYIMAANKIAYLCGLNHLASFHVADARDLPFDDEEFNVVWSQCSLAHDEKWLQECDRVLKQNGRLALTFSIRKEKPDQRSPKWTLQDIINQIKNLGYNILHGEDVTKRDIEIGWKALDKQLSEQEEEFAQILGDDWVRGTHEKFSNEIELMLKGQWGNGRIIAEKLS